MEENRPRPRFQFSLRTLFVVVTLVCVGCWMWRRSVEFAIRADEHRELIYEAKFSSSYLYDETRDLVSTDAHRHYRQCLSEYHQDLFWKFERAAKYPFLPVATDPPPPQIDKSASPGFQPPLNPG